MQSRLWKEHIYTMKKSFYLRKSILIFAVVTIFFCACGELEIEESVQINIEQSSLWEKSEIQSAIDTTIDYFDANFIGCTLVDISYDEELCMKEKDYWIEQYHADEAIILTSTFDVDENGGDGSFNPNATYANWMWVLTRSDSDAETWTLQTWGY